MLLTVREELGEAVLTIFLFALYVLRKKVDVVNAHKTEILVLNVRMEQLVRLLDTYM
jgi:hypothetical protein